MGYWMYDARGRGDSGGMSNAITFSEDGKSEPVVEHDSKPKVGACMKVGSIFGRTFSRQDWWMTTPVAEILEDTSNYVKFKTHSGSIYEWRDEQGSQLKVTQ